jgi:hypothetical protein
MEERTWPKVVVALLRDGERDRGIILRLMVAALVTSRGARVATCTNALENGVRLDALAFRSLFG